MNNAQQDADDSGTDNDQTVNSNASQLRRSGSRTRNNNNNNNNNNNSPGVEWNASQNAHGFYQEPILAPTMPVDNDQANDTKHDNLSYFINCTNFCQSDRLGFLTRVHKM